MSLYPSTVAAQVGKPLTKNAAGLQTSQRSALCKRRFGLLLLHRGGSDGAGMRHRTPTISPFQLLLPTSDVVAAGPRSRQRRLKVDHGVVGRRFVIRGWTRRSRQPAVRHAREVEIRVVDPYWWCRWRC